MISPSASLKPFLHLPAGCQGSSNVITMALDVKGISSRENLTALPLHVNCSRLSKAREQRHDLIDKAGVLQELQARRADTKK